MANNIIDGKQIAQRMREMLAKKVQASGLVPVLKVLLVGNNPASQVYVKNKLKAAQDVGIDCEIIRFDDDASQEELLQKIQMLNEDDKVDGMIVQLPLPTGFDVLKVLSAVRDSKDVDGFSPYNAGLLAMGDKSAFVPATPRAVLKLLQETNINLAGKNVVIVGRSNIVGKPLAMLLLNNDATVTIAHSKTKNLSEITNNADIVVMACGVPKLLKSDWIKKGTIVIDVGINKIDNKLCGDVDFDEVVEKAGYITPVPGGVGPMTVAMLLENTFDAATKNKDR